MSRRVFGLSFLAAAFVAAGGSFAVAGAGLSPDVARVRERLAHHQNFAKPPLFPTEIPHKVGCCNAILGIDGQHYFASFMAHRRKLEVGFFRLGHRDLRADIKRGLAFGGAVHTVRIRGRTYHALKFRGSELTGPHRGRRTRQLFWRRQGYTYAFSSPSSPEARVNFQTLIKMAESTRRLG